jgi:hypothetical protein
MPKNKIKNTGFWMNARRSKIRKLTEQTTKKDLRKDQNNS